MKKIFHLSKCSTCQRIIKDINVSQSCALQDIKEQSITPEQLDEMKAMAGSYEALFSRKAIKYRSMGLGEKKLTEEDYRRLILEEYTFLKRPVVIVGNQIFIGNAKASVEGAKKAIEAK